MKTFKVVCDICKSEIDPSLPGSLELSFTMRPEKTPRSFDICTADSCRGEILRLFYRDPRKDAGQDGLEATGSSRRSGEKTPDRTAG